MDGCGTTFATTPYKKGGYGSGEVTVSNSPALFRRSALASTRDPQSGVPSRDAPEFAPLSLLRRRRVRLSLTALAGFFFLSECRPLGEATHDGSDPKSARSTPLGAIAMTVLWSAVVAARSADTPWEGEGAQ